MKLRRVFTVVAASVSTFLLVAVALVATLEFVFSAIVAVPAGLLAGLGVFAILLVTLEDFSAPVRRLVTAYVLFGLAVVAALAARYSNLGPSRDALSIDVIAAGAVAVAALTYVVLWWQDRTSACPRANPN